VARRRGGSAESFPAVSIAHADGLIVALSAFSPVVGIDVEKIKPREASFESVAFDVQERELLDRCESPAARHEAVTRFWCAREAVAKGLGRGLVEGPGSLAVRGWDPTSGTLLVVPGPRLSEAFPDFQGAHIIAQTVREGDVIVATTFGVKQT
jgi:phosphopantetheinyl transferase